MTYPSHPPLLVNVIRGRTLRIDVLARDHEEGLIGSS
jgi:hypothetical protein